MKTHRLLVLSLGVIHLSCGSGGFEQVELSGECAGALACGTDLDDGPLAVGASVEIRAALSVPGAGLPAIELIAADDTILESVGDRVTGVGPGMSAILIADDNGVVIDFFHVFVELPDHLQLARVDGASAGADLDGVLELLVGDELTLTTRPSLGGQVLAGTASSQWAVSGSAVTVLSDGDPARRRLVAREVGSTEITIESMGLTRTFTIQVLP